MPDGAMIETPRLLLRRWRDTDWPAFAAMNADPEVMHDLGGPITRAESDGKLDRYAAAFDRDGLSRWVIEDRGSAEFLGYAGLLHRASHPLGAHFDLAWRLERTAWGRGYATEAASAALNDAFMRVGLVEAFAYTSRENLRSQAVMARLGLRRDPSRDFTATYDGFGEWSGLVWVARPVRARP
ncbi:GNAT family N-acetyltransferase [Phenylobacterium sp.]|uniref:GNAT family N-acetyltransferase n=1 Tax=Phenylobacterium sp. TaxID=1871053 RepID=UPI002F3F7352